MAKTTPVDASPTKQFFVRMLTRDIDLREAILDLLDNCVDGIIRTNKGCESVNSAKPYEGFCADITANKNEFVIEDNCGGIPQTIAEKVAFRLGRPSESELTELGLRTEKLQTVGLYGIGMKRAIFKMGRQAVVISEHKGNAFRVEIAPDWLDSPGDWNLTLTDVAPSGTSGTQIKVTSLHPEIAKQFSPDRNFLSDLHDAISQLFAVIIKKGFVVRLNGTAVKPVLVKLLVDGNRQTLNISPYVLEGQLKDVRITVVVGFQRDPSSMSEMDADNGDRQKASRQAGWTVICNDRLVLYGDKSEMTGWGTKPVPRFHPQFNAIAGVVTLGSDNLNDLPLNTKKRGIDLSSPGVYLKVLDFMMGGVKRFTDFTNKWKERQTEIARYFDNTKSMVATEIPRRIPRNEFTGVPSSRLADESARLEEFNPALPLPTSDATTGWIRFSKPLAEIREVGGGILDDEDAKPSKIGEACFDQVLRNTRKSKKK